MSSVAAASLATGGGPRLDPFVARLAHGRGAGIDRADAGRGPSRDELRLYARLLAIDAEAEPPTARVWMRLGPGGRAALALLGVETEAEAGDLVSAIVSLPRLAHLARLPEIEWIQVARRARIELDDSVPEVRADVARAQYGSAGAGVLLGFVDTGVDLTHGDLRNPDGTTRVLEYWNQTFNCGSPPPGFGYGCRSTAAQIDSFLSGGPLVTAPDADGHGTHTAAIAAGDGSQTGNGQPAGTYVGVAPGAKLIVVKVFSEPEAPDCGACDIGDAIAYIDQRAAALGMPYVIALSLGYDMGAHDGTDAIEQLIDALTGPGIPGKAVVKSAGNTRGWGIHASGTVANGTFQDRSFTVPPYTPVAGSFNDIQAWNLVTAAGDSVSVRITSPMGSTLTNATGGACTCAVSPFPACTTDAQCPGSYCSDFDAVETSDGVMIIEEFCTPAPNGSRLFELEVDDQLGAPPRAGTWTVRVTGNTITQGGHFDSWIWSSSFGASALYADWNMPDLSMLLTIPGTAFHATTVGAYLTKRDWIDIDGNFVEYIGAPPEGDLADFSAPGPTRDGRIKPEIAAPGQGIASALSADAAPGVLANLDDRILVVPDGQHWVLAGTSFAAPHVAGTYALLLALEPSLDATQLRALVTSTARADGFTGGALPDSDWGYGKLDAAAAVEMLVKPIPDLTAQVGGATFQWSASPLATTYNVYRADADLLDGTFYGTCLLQGLVSPSFTDLAAPPARKAFSYVVTGVKDGIEGLLGFRSDGSVRPNTFPCS